MNHIQTLKIDNSQKEFQLIPLVDSIRIIPEKGTPFAITNNGSNNISITVNKTDGDRPAWNIPFDRLFYKISDNINKTDILLDYYVDIFIITHQFKNKHFRQQRN